MADRLQLMTDTHGRQYVPIEMLSTDRVAIFAEAFAEQMSYAKVLTNLRASLSRERRRVKQLRRAVLAHASRRAYFRGVLLCQEGGPFFGEFLRLADRARDVAGDGKDGEG